MLQFADRFLPGVEDVVLSARSRGYPVEVELVHQLPKISPQFDFNDLCWRSSRLDERDVFIYSSKTFSFVITTVK